MTQSIIEILEKKDDNILIGKINYLEWYEVVNIVIKEYSISNYIKVWINELIIFTLEKEDVAILPLSELEWWIVYRRENKIWITNRIFPQWINLNNLNKIRKTINIKNRELTNKEIENLKKDGIIFEWKPMLFEEFNINYDMLKNTICYLLSHLNYKPS